MRRVIAGACLLGLLALTGCGEEETALTDETGEFSYDGPLQQVGDDENGYLQVPADFVPFQDEDVEGMTQYSDTTGKNIFTLDHYEDVTYMQAAENVRGYMSEQEDVEGLTGATVTLHGYNALQVYGHYTDGYFMVVWLLEDTAAPEDCYYLALEFDNDHQYMMACSSTFLEVQDYQTGESGGTADETPAP